MPAKRDPSLLPDEENSTSLSARIIRYVTTVGRVIIIFTELIVISAFISRFWLDRRNSDLSEVIRQRQAILQSTQDFEKQYSQLQQQLATVKKVNSVDPKFEDKIQTVVESTPADITFSRFNIDTSKQPTASLSITAFKESSIIDFIVNLTLNPNIQKVNILQIEKKPKNTQYFVDLDLVYKTSNSNGT